MSVFVFLSSSPPSQVDGKGADNKFVVDAFAAGNVARFLNHACGPGDNCHVRPVRWGSDDEDLSHLAVFAKCDIAPGDELLYNYGYKVEPRKEKVRCQCGQAECRGYFRNVRKPPTDGLLERARRAERRAQRHQMRGTW